MDLILLGDQHGLSLELDLETKYNLRNGISKREGVKVVIHEPTKVPLVSSDGIVVVPNTETHVSMEKIHIER